jgi:hypothetical protein
MKRVGRYFINCLALLSLPLCIATVVLWVRSYRHGDIIGCEGRETADHWQRGGYVWSGVGTIACEWWLRQNAQPASPSDQGWAYTTWPLRSPAPSKPWHHFSYGVQSFNNSRPSSDGRPMPVRMTYAHQLSAPHWFILLLAMLPASFWILRARRRRRQELDRRQNRCPQCGYDLRATPGRCPECGTVVPL